MIFKVKVKNVFQSAVDRIAANCNSYDTFYIFFIWQTMSTNSPKITELHKMYGSEAIDRKVL